jgi:hypothetical protein
MTADSPGTSLRQTAVTNRPPIFSLFSADRIGTYSSRFSVSAPGWRQAQ